MGRTVLFVFLLLASPLGCLNEVVQDPAATASDGIEQQAPQALASITCNNQICPAPLPYPGWPCSNAWGQCTCTVGVDCVDFLPCDWSHTPAANEAYLGFHTEGDPLNVQCGLIYQPNDPNNPWKDVILGNLSSFHADTDHSYLYKIKTGSNFYGYLYPDNGQVGNGCIVWPSTTSGVDPSRGWTTDNTCSGIFTNNHISSIHFYKWNTSINP